MYKNEEKKLKWNKFSLVCTTQISKKPVEFFVFWQWRELIQKKIRSSKEKIQSQTFLFIINIMPSKVFWFGFHFCNLNNSSVGKFTAYFAPHAVQAQQHCIIISSKIIE